MEPGPRRILVVDDDEDQIHLIRGWYKNQPLTVLEAHDGIEGLRVAANEQPDLILLDMSMPGLDGIETVKRLKSNPALATTPVIMLTAHREIEYKTRAFAAGGDDYVVKPFEFDELDARIRAMLRKRDLYLDLERKNRELADSNRHLEELAILDEKTGLANFRQFRRKLHEEWLRAERYQHPLSLIMLDLDDFKRLNDTLGHTAGDEALREIATLVAGAARATDLPARFGGEEFVLLLPHTDSPMAARVAERILSAVRQHVFLAGEHPTSLTVSAGVATYDAGDPIASAEDLVKFADAALYRAKGAGKNRVKVHNADEHEGRTLPH
jgi:diguanylate cyclase (GGDEF)-like protein